MALKPPPKQLSRQRRDNAKKADREQAKRDERRDRAEAAARKREDERRMRERAKALDTDSHTVTSTAGVFRITIQATGSTLVLGGPNPLPW
jgi:hypothetical protein